MLLMARPGPIDLGQRRETRDADLLDRRVRGGDGSGLSPHLRSRAEVGDILLASSVPTAALQAAVIIGSGSASFEMLRYLTERLPVMVTPKWVGTRIQPIAVGDVLRYLVGCAALPPDVNRRFDIGGPDVLTYAEMMRHAERLTMLAWWRDQEIKPCTQDERRCRRGRGCRRCERARDLAGGSRCR
jgi:nucleoside-diphosphate-sugar epimerase